MVAAVARRHRRGLAGAAVVLALVVAGAAYFVTTRRPPTPIADAPASLQDLEVVQLTTSGNAERPAISPDGKFVAYIQRDGNATSLWVRQTATASNVQIVPPQPNVTLWAATVTPDGGFVDFVHQEAAQPPALWRVPFLGGTPKRLIDGVYSAIGWSPDGQRLAFVRISERTTALVIADRDGGHERTVATRRLPAAFNGVYHPSRSSNRPAWSADGRVIAVMGHTDNAAYRVVLVEVASGAERLVPIPGDFPDAVAWLNAASFVLNPIATGGTLRQLWRLSYPGGQASRLTNDLSSYLDVSVTGDAGSLVTARSKARMSIWIGNGVATAGGEEVPPAPFAASGLTVMSIDWAADHVVYVTTTGGRHAIARVLPGQPTPEDVVSAGRGVRASPDGRTIVYQVAGQGGTSDGLWKADADGRNAVQLVKGSDGNFPLITPDNRYVVFQSTRLSPWIVPIGGGTPTQVANVFYLGLGADVRRSPGGASLVFRSIDAQGQPVVLMCDLPACTKRRTLSLPAGHLHWTPDGRGVAYINGATRQNIWVQPLAGGQPRQLTHFTDRTVADFAWSRDGTRFAVARATVTNDIVLFKGLR
jgi:Tol biopolymer transport system component